MIITSLLSRSVRTKKCYAVVWFLCLLALAVGALHLTVAWQVVFNSHLKQTFYNLVAKGR